MSKFDLVKLMWYHNKVRWKVRRLSGAPPLSFKGKGKNLKNYRIYGNTVNGESVGDRTGNLFDGTFIHRSVIGAVIGDDDPNRRSIVIDISNFNNGDKITFSRETGVGSTFQMYQVNSPLKGGALLNSNVFSGNSETLLATITLDNIANYPYLMIFLNGAVNPITDEELLASKIMVNVGNTALPYEPYGYRVPVTVTNGTDTETTNIYLPEQIKMVGDEAEYIDFGEQKQHRVRKNLFDGSFIHRSVIEDRVSADDPNRRSIVIDVSSYANGNKITFSRETSAGNVFQMYQVDSPLEGGRLLGTNMVADDPNTLLATIILNNISIYPYLMIFLNGSLNPITDEELLASKIMVNVENTDLDVTLPALPTLSGTNTLSVGTEVQPSEVYVEGKIRFIHEGSGENEGE